VADSPHIAPATTEVVRSGGSAARTVTRIPLSARQTAVVNPITPANVPPIKTVPAVGDQITFANNVVTVAD